MHSTRHLMHSTPTPMHCTLRLLHCSPKLVHSIAELKHSIQPPLHPNPKAAHPSLKVMHPNPKPAHSTPKKPKAITPPQQIHAFVVTPPCDLQENTLPLLSGQVAPINIYVNNRADHLHTLHMAVAKGQSIVRGLPKIGMEYARRLADISHGCGGQRPADLLEDSPKL